MNTRRFFLKTTAQVSAYTLFLSYLSACKSGDKKAMETVKEEMIKSLSLQSNASYQMEYLRGDVGFFTERGGTIGWVANKEGLIIVDTQFPEQSEHLVTELKKVNDQTIDLVINTHHHGDHSSGNTYLKDVSKRILAHANSKKNQLRVAEERNQEVVLPDDTFTDTREEKVAGESIKLYYYGAGHTDGDAITHFENANVVHMGDLIFNRRFPYIDKSAGAMIDNWVKVLDQTLKTFDHNTLYIFGHADNGYGVTGKREDIKAFQNYLEKLLEFGQQSIAAGKTLEELKSETMEIPGASEWKGKGIDRSLDAVYAELTG